MRYEFNIMSLLMLTPHPQCEEEELPTEEQHS